jgi:hypothetical protein
MTDPMLRGRFAQPIRRGDTVERLMGPGADNVHALLEHFAQVGFALAPRWLGTTSRGPAVTQASLKADLMAANARSIRLTEQVRQLEQRLSKILGEQVWRDSGIGPPADIDTLQTRITELEQQNVDLRLQLEEKDEELSAARAANRELTKNINHEPRRTS